MERCIVEGQAWITTNRLKLNGDKTKLIIPSSPFNRQEIDVEHIQAGSAVSALPFVSAIWQLFFIVI